MFRIEKLTIRLNALEIKAIRENADKMQISMSEYIRKLVFDNGGTTTPPLHQ